MSTHSSETNNEQQTMGIDDAQEFQNLPRLLTEWKKIQEEKRKLVDDKRIILERISEHDKRCEVMEQMIMGTMKKHSIAALDLKSSNARVLYKKASRKAPISKKNMEKLVGEHLKSLDAAKKLLEFLDEKRETKIKESLVYEKKETVT
jgi:hypothetical protein|uniref:Uncharacterized protein n=1 Tax=viral metagenome TaxID=1070528 RepID=A0A6C0K7Z7_9ZZZZ